jgi:oligogalacturonide transport system permease protein
MKKTKKHSLTIKHRNALTGYLFFSPWIIGFLVFTLFPIIYSIRLSLNSLQITTKGILMTWKGFEYYNEALKIDTTFTTALWDTVIFIGCATPIILVFSLILAILLNGKYPLRAFFRGVFFLPVIIMSGPVISDLLSQYSVTFSIANPGIYSFVNGLPAIINKPVLFALNNLVLILWFSGVQILIFIAGLQKVGSEIYEAASIDGATAWEKFWKITLPYVKPLVLVNAIYTVMEIANYSNNNVNIKINSHLLEVNQPYSYSAAMSWIYFSVILFLLLVVYSIFQGFGRRENL